MCVVDEAEIRAIGFTPVDRGEGSTPFPHALAPFDDPVIVSAGDRLVARGLALPEPTDRWAVQASGPLLAWFVGHVLPAHPTVVVDVAATPADRLPRGRRRVTVLARTGMTLVEYVDVPAHAGADPLAVRIDAVRADVLVEELASLAFTPPREGEQLAVTLLTTAAHGPARLVADHGVVGLHTRGHGLRKNATRTQRIDKAGFSRYLEGMLEQLVR